MGLGDLLPIILPFSELKSDHFEQICDFLWQKNSEFRTRMIMKTK